MIRYLLAFVCFAVVLLWDVETDYKKWKEDKSVKHSKEWFIKSILLLPSLYFLSQPFDFVTIILSIGLEAFLYLLLFDGLYNLKRKQNWWFLGSIDDDDAWWDKLQRRIPLTLLKILKIGIPLLFLILYIIN